MAKHLPNTNYAIYIMGRVAKERGIVQWLTSSGPDELLHAVGKTTVDSKVGQRLADEKRLATRTVLLLRLKSVKAKARPPCVPHPARAKGTSGRTNSKYAVKPKLAGIAPPWLVVGWGGILLIDMHSLRSTAYIRKYVVHTCRLK